MSPLCIDLYCGLGGWAEGFLSEGWRVIGFDIERRDYPGQLVLQDVSTLSGAQFKSADCIVASPPCQAYSYRAMPWKRVRSLPPPDNTLFEACFRIQREASVAAGRTIPLVVENVMGAQKWVGQAAWHYGSYYLWGDIPALMPWVFASPVKSNQGTHERLTGKGRPRFIQEDLFADRDRAGIKQHGSGEEWFRTGSGALPSHSPRRRAASARIAKIPFPLAQHIARVYRP